MMVEMSTPTEHQARVGRPAVTSRAEILAAARRIIDRDGWEKLTIRRLAAELGVGVATVYRHVRDREDLLIQLLNEYAERTLPANVDGTARDRIVAAGIAIHDSLTAEPWAAEVLTTDGFIARLGTPAVRMVEIILDGAVNSGCTPEQAVHVFRNIWYFIAGEVLVRTHSAARQAGIRQGVSDDAFFGELDAAALPRLTAIGEQWPILAAQETFPDGLRALVDGLLAQATSADRTGA